MSEQAVDYQQILQDKQNELMKRISAIKQDFADGRSADFAEQTTERENDDVLKSLQYESSVELRQVNEALSRIKTGEFGICAKCGDEISEQRLSILPYTQFCIRCAQ